MKNSEENKTSELLRFIGAIIIGLDISFIPTLVVLLFLGFKTLAIFEYETFNQNTNNNYILWLI